MPGRSEPILLPARLAGAAAAAAHPRRGAPVRAQAPPAPAGEGERHRLAVRAAAGRRPGPQEGAAGALRVARRRARSDRRRAGVGARPAAQDGARDPRLPEQDRRRGGRRERRSTPWSTRRPAGASARSSSGATSRSTTSRREDVDRPASAPRTPAQRELTDLLVAYFAGERVTFADFDLAPTLAWAGVTPFEERCLRELQQVPVRRDRLLRRAGAARGPRARASRGRLGLRARYPLDRRALSPRDPRRRQHRRVGPGGQRLQASACSAWRACTCEGPAHRLPRRRHRPVDGAARAEGGRSGADRDRDADRRRRLVRPAAPRPRHPAARRRPGLPGGAGRGRVVHGQHVPAPLLARRAGRPQPRQPVPGGADRARRLVRRGGRADVARARDRRRGADGDPRAGGAGGRDGGRPRRRRRVGRRVRSQPRAAAAAGAARPRGASRHRRGDRARRPDRARARLAVHVDAAAAAGARHPRRRAGVRRRAACTSRTCSSSPARRSATTPATTSTGSSSTSGRASSTRSSSRTSGASRPT